MSGDSNSRSGNGDGRSSNGNGCDCGRGDDVSSDADMGIGIGFGFSLREMKAGRGSDLYIFWESDDGHTYGLKCCNGDFVEDFQDDDILMVLW